MTDIPRITSRLDLPRWLVQKGLVGKGAEVGVLFGDYSAHLLEYWTGTLHMIDCWEQQSADVYLDGSNSVSMRNAYAKSAAVANRFGGRGIMTKAYSLNASTKFGDGELCFAYIDANHSHDFVAADLRAWWPKVMNGGVMGGHDFYNKHSDWFDCDVQNAVEEFCLERGLEFYVTPECTSWWVEKG